MAPDPKTQTSEKGDDLTPQRKDVLVYDTPGFFAEDSRVPLWAQSLITDVFSFVTTHYFVWSWPFLALFYYLYKNGRGYVAAALVALYLPSFFSGAQKTGNGNMWQALRTSSVWGLTNKFLRIKIIREQELDPKLKYIFGFHPHGIIVLSRLAIFGENFDRVFPGVTNRLLGASAMYYIPLGREMCLWMGGVDASRSTGDKVLKEGNSIIVYPGGVPEIFKTDPNSKETQLVLQKRLGFIKLAMRHGAHLVPTFVFGEKWLYNMWTPPTGVTDFFRKTLGVPVLIFWGKFGWMPKAPAKGKRFGLVYGKPIATTVTPNPTDAELRAVHEQYVTEIHRIFEQYKADFGLRSRIEVLDTLQQIPEQSNLVMIHHIVNLLSSDSDTFEFRSFLAMDPKLRASDNQSQHRQDVLVYDAPGFFAENSRVPLWTQNLLTDLFSFVTTHYFIWSWPVVALFYYLYKNGLGYVVVAILVLYVPPFFNGVHKTGQGNEWGIVRTSSLWGMMNKVLRTKIIREQPLDPTKKYVFGFHPHGILVLSRLAICGGNFENVIPDITYRILGASAMYFVPLGREFCLWMGGVDASRSTADKVFKEGNSVVVYPGGTAEIFRTDPYSTETQLVLQERLGFIKLAMSHGADLVPTFVFGEKWLYNMWTPPKGVTDFFRKTLRIPVLVFWGKFWWIPKAPPAGKRFGLVYGNPIATKLTPNPTESELRAVHEKYVAEIHRIFEEHKADFGYGEDETLAII